MKTLIEKIASDLEEEGVKLSIGPNSILRIASEGTDGVGLVANKLSVVLARELKLIKNVVISQVESLETIVNKMLSDRVVYNAVDSIEMNKINRVGIVDLAIERLKIGASGPKVDTPSVTINPPDNMYDYVVTNIAGLDAELQTYLQANPDYLGNLWTKYVEISGPTNMVFNTLYGNYDSTARDLVFLYVIYTNLLDQVPSTVRMDMSKYIDIIQNLRNMIANQLIRLQSNYDKWDRNEVVVTVVKNINSNEKEISVYVPMLTKYLTKEDSRLEDVLAVAVTDGQYNLKTVENIYSNREKLRTSWEEYKTMNDSLFKFKDFENMKLIYKLGFSKFLKELDTDTKELIPETILNVAEKNVSDYVDNLDYETIQNSNVVCEDIIYGLLFTHTNANEFIASMRKYEKLHTGLTPNEAATLATVDLIVAYLMQHVTVTKTV